MVALLVTFLLVLTAAALVIPFLRRSREEAYPLDEDSPLLELERRWESAVEALKSAELEYAIGTLAEEDYRWLRQRYMREAALVLRAMDLERRQEERLLEELTRQLRQVRSRVAGPPGEATAPCPACGGVHPDGACPGSDGATRGHGG